jgi:dipeptidyl aminopeptidase/acylaminoacyl peptidase
MSVRTPRIITILALVFFAAHGSGQDAKPKDAKKFGPDSLGKLVGVADPQISPDGKSIVVRVSRPNYEKNKLDAELVLVDVASGKQRVLTYDRAGVGRARWSPKGDRLAFLARFPGDQ